MTMIVFQEWYSASELTGLPDLPKTATGVRIFLLKGAGPSYVRDRNGVTTFHFGLLPTRAVARLLTAAMDENTARAAEYLGPVWLKAYRRLLTLWAVEHLEWAGYSTTAAVAMVARFGEGRRTSIWKWRAEVEGIRRTDRFAVLVAQAGREAAS